MEYKHISEIDFKGNMNTRVFGIFLAKDVNVRTQKDGKTKFISLTMCDKGLELDTKKFSASDKDIEDMQNGHVYAAAIDVKPYERASNGISLTLYNFEEINESPANFVLWADGMEDAQEIIQNALETINESIYNKLVYNVLIRNWQKFCVWAAATGMHHNVMGGLLVHTAEVIEQSEIIADFWNDKYGPNFINKPLLLSGALLHDIGKTEELDVDTNCGVISYSTKASLETHITMCVSMIDVEAYKLQLGYQVYRINEINEQEPVKSEETLQIEQEAVNLLKHLILSHHGKKEYGSPIEASCPEASILNMADGLSAEMFRYNKTLSDMQPFESSSVWLSGSIQTTYKDSTKQ